MGRHRYTLEKLRNDWNILNPNITPLASAVYLALLFLVGFIGLYVLLGVRTRGFGEALKDAVILGVVGFVYLKWRRR